MNHLDHDCAECWLSPYSRTVTFTMSPWQVAGISLGLDCKEYNTPKTIVDTGTTNLRLPTSVFAKFTEQLKAQVTGLKGSPSTLSSGTQFNPKCYSWDASTHQRRWRWQPDMSFFSSLTVLMRRQAIFYPFILWSFLLCLAITRLM